MFQRARSRVQEQQKRRGKRSKKPKTWDKSTYQIKTINIHWKFMCEMQRYVDYCWCLVPLHVRSLFYGRLKICFFFISFRFGPLRIYFPQTELSSGSNKISRKIWKFGSLYWEKMKKKNRTKHTETVELLIISSVKIKNDEILCFSFVYRLPLSPSLKKKHRMRIGKMVEKRWE